MKPEKMNIMNFWIKLEIWKPREENLAGNYIENKYNL